MSETKPILESVLMILKIVDGFQLVSKAISLGLNTIAFVQTIYLVVSESFSNYSITLMIIYLRK